MDGLPRPKQITFGEVQESAVNESCKIADEPNTIRYVLLGIAVRSRTCALGHPAFALVFFRSAMYQQRQGRPMAPINQGLVSAFLTRTYRSKGVSITERTLVHGRFAHQGCLWFKAGVRNDQIASFGAIGGNKFSNKNKLILR
jgi:hypothetical protein